MLKNKSKKTVTLVLDLNRLKLLVWLAQQAQQHLLSKASLLDKKLVREAMKDGKKILSLEQI